MTSVDPAVYQALVIAKALDLYARTGIKVNRAYTPTAMMRMATKITGKAFKARDYAVAAQALRDHIEQPRLPL